MSVHQVPQDEPYPEPKPFPVMGVRRIYATFRCVECECVYAGDIPAIFEDLPACPLCAAASCIVCVLEPDVTH